MKVYLFRFQFPNHDQSFIIMIHDVQFEGELQIIVSLSRRVVLEIIIGTTMDAYVKLECLFNTFVWLIPLLLIDEYCTDLHGYL